MLSMQICKIASAEIVHSRVVVSIIFDGCSANVKRLTLEICWHL